MRRNHNGPNTLLWTEDRRQRKCQASWLLNYSLSAAVRNALNAFLDSVLLNVNYAIVRKSLKHFKTLQFVFWRVTYMKINEALNAIDL